MSVLCNYCLFVFSYLTLWVAELNVVDVCLVHTVVSQVHWLLLLPCHGEKKYVIIPMVVCNFYFYCCVRWILTSALHCKWAFCILYVDHIIKWFWYVYSRTHEHHRYSIWIFCQLLLREVQVMKKSGHWRQYVSVNNMLLAVLQRNYWQYVSVNNMLLAVLQRNYLFSGQNKKEKKIDTVQIVEADTFILI